MRAMYFLAAVAAGLSSLAGLNIAGEPARPDPGWTFACAPDNDLHRALAAGGVECPRFATAAEAVRAAAEGSGVLILADGYPDRFTPVPPEVFGEAARKHLRLYVEYPEGLPDLELGPPRGIKFERAVVTSEIFGEALRPLRILLAGSCRYRPAKAPGPHIVIAKVAGVDTAVFGLDGTPADPILFDHPRGGILVATTKLSGFVAGRYLPADAWRIVWRTILARLRPGEAPPELRSAPTVRPAFGPADPLPADAELQALRRSAEWIIRARVLRQPDWPKEALDLSRGYNTVRPMPRPDWPRGDGSLGVLEGFSSTILPDGGQPMRWAVRNDCTAEVAMLMALDGAVDGRPEHIRVARNLVDYIFGPSGLAGGSRADPKSPSFGLVGWALDSPGGFWGDDNARALLAAGAVAALSGERGWNEAVARCILANFRTTGPSGFREACIHEADLQVKGWRAYWTGRRVHLSPHFQSWIWACNFWAFSQTRFEPLLARSVAGLRSTMHAYPGRWDWCLRSGTIERARLLLPLAWLVRVADTPEHRGWLRTVAADLIALQDPCGAIRETIGDGGRGLPSNAAYGTGEISLIQEDGDPVADMLYSCNFALIGLHEAAAATGDPLLAEAEEKLARFLCRIQARSEAHPELGGAWFRAFDFRRWEYWASSADWEWGPWCAETGWTQPWIAGTMALRRRGASLWDLVGKVDLREPFDRLRPAMLPDADLIPPRPAATMRHAALGKPARLVAPPDSRYPAAGEESLTDGEGGSTDYLSPEWLGFHGVDMEAAIDLGAPMEVRAVAVRSLQSVDVGIYLPVRIEVSLSLDGKAFDAAARIEGGASPQEPGPFIRSLRADLEPRRARWVRVRAVSMRTIPAGHPAAGEKAWLFVDEILVNP